MKKVIPSFDAVQEGRSLDERLSQVMEGARETAGVDRLHLWALAPEGERLVYVLGSGLSQQNRRSLDKRPEIHLAKAGAMAKSLRDKQRCWLTAPMQSFRSCYLRFAQFIQAAISPRHC